MYHFELQQTDGSHRRPPTFPELDAQLAAGRQDLTTGERTLRVLGVRDDDADQPPALVVEDTCPGPTTGAAG